METIQTRPLRSTFWTFPAPAAAPDGEAFKLQTNRPSRPGPGPGSWRSASSYWLGRGFCGLGGHLRAARPMAPRRRLARQCPPARSWLRIWRPRGGVWLGLSTIWVTIEGDGLQRPGARIGAMTILGQPWLFRPFLTNDSKATVSVLYWYGNYPTPTVKVDFLDF